MREFVRRVVRNEPVVVNAIRAVAVMLVAFNVPIEDADVEHGIEVLSQVLALASVLVTRRKVSPVEGGE